MLDELLKSLMLSQSSADQCVYIQNHENVKTIIAVYVDDLVIMCENKRGLMNVKQALARDST